MTVATASWPRRPSAGLLTTVPAVTAPDLHAAADVIDLAQRVVGKAIRHLASNGGPDANQTLAYDLAHAAAQVETARSLLDYGGKGDVEAKITCAFTADMIHDLISRLAGREALWGLEVAPLKDAHSFLASYRDPAFIASLAATAGPRHLDSEFEMVQDTFRAFADNEIKPRAEHVHRHNDDVPEEIISGLAEMGVFGLSVPAEYGGFSEGGDGEYIGMVVATEELSRGSLGIGGSLITRPEILTRALVKGGTEAQKQEWLPKLATAEVMAAVAVTEPDYGSDVAGIKVTATRTDGSRGRRRLGDQRRQDVVHLRRPAPTCSCCSPGPTRTAPRRTRDSACSSCPSPAATATASSSPRTPTDRSAAASWRAGRSTPSATAACTATRWRSTTGGCRQRT